MIDTRIEVMDTLTYEWSVGSNWKHQAIAEPMKRSNVLNRLPLNSRPQACLAETATTHVAPLPPTSVSHTSGALPPSLVLVRALSVPVTTLPFPPISFENPCFGGSSSCLGPLTGRPRLGHASCNEPVAIRCRAVRSGGCSFVYFCFLGSGSSSCGPPIE